MNYMMSDTPEQFASLRVAPPGGDVPIYDQKLKKELRVARTWPAER